MTQPLQAMVVLASEQLWPNIHGLVHWQKHEGGLSDLCIYYTEDEHRSARPARRLQEFCQELYPQIRVHLPPRPLGILPQDVRNQVRIWQAQLPGRRWIVNATGGLKPMFAGAISCCDLPNTEVVYRELGGDWQRWLSSPEGPKPVPFFVDLSETDSIPIQSLVKVQYNSPPDAHWKVAAIKPLPILALVQKGLETGWKWEAMFRECGIANGGQAGFLFEDFVGACLLELGIGEICKNILLQEAQKQTLQEIDLAANYRGQLLIIDCKLRTQDEDKIISQILQAYTVCRELGGAGARLLLLRPGLRFSAEEIELADALRLHVLDARQTMDFFRKLAEFCGFRGPLPSQLQAAQEQLDRARANGILEAFACSRWCRSLPCEEPLQTILPVGSSLEALTQDLQQDWIAYQIDRYVWIRGKNFQGLSASAIEQRVQTLFSQLPGLNIAWEGVSKDSSTYYVRLYPRSGEVISQLKQFLA